MKIHMVNSIFAACLTEHNEKLMWLNINKETNKKESVSAAKPSEQDRGSL